MAKPEILWTFLPNGIRDGKLRFSAAVSIRLPEDAGPKPNLGLFPEILAWAETVRGLAFEQEGVEVHAGLIAIAWTRVPGAVRRGASW